MTEDTKKKLIIAVVGVSILAVLTGIGFYFWRILKAPPPLPPAEEKNKPTEEEILRILSQPNPDARPVTSEEKKQIIESLSAPSTEATNKSTPPPSPEQLREARPPTPEERKMLDILNAPAK